MVHKIYFIRHCQAEGQQKEAPLTVKGQEDATKLVTFLKEKKIEAIYSSPFVRAVQTATPLANHLGLSIQTDDRLSERILSSENMPDWMNKLKATFNDLEIKYNGGESSQEAINRALEVLNEILYTGVETLAVVTHGNLMSLMLHHIDNTYGFDAWAALTNPDVFLLSHNEGEFELKRLWS